MKRLLLSWSSKHRATREHAHRYREGRFARGALRHVPPARGDVQEVTGDQRRGVDRRALLGETLKHRSMRRDVSGDGVLAEEVLLRAERLHDEHVLVVVVPREAVRAGWRHEHLDLRAAEHALEV